MDSSTIDIIGEAVEYNRDHLNIEGKKSLERLLAHVENVIDKSDLRAMCKYFLIESLARTGTFTVEDLNVSVYANLRDKLNQVVVHNILKPYNTAIAAYKAEIGMYETEVRKKKRQKTAAADIEEALADAAPAASSSGSKIRFTISVAPPTPKLNSVHRYTKQSTITTRSAYDGLTYCKARKLRELAVPGREYGHFDFNNHAYLVSAEENAPVFPEYAGKRLTVSKMTNMEFALLAMQVVSKRTRAVEEEEETDYTFNFLCDVFRGKTELLVGLPAPACLTHAQKCEIIFSFVYLYVCIDTDEELRETCNKIQNRWLHGGMQVTLTKHPGWIQNPRGAGHR